MREFLLDELDPSDVFYDIGSNVGQYACFVGQVINAGNLVCFEPHPKTAERLKENLGLNSIEDFIILNTAVSNRSGTIDYELGTDAPGGMGYVANQSSNDSVSIPVINIDDAIGEYSLPFPNVVKMDIHGEEWHALKGMNQTLNDDRCRLMICELHERYVEEKGGSVEEIISMMENHGFTHSYDPTNSRAIFSKEGTVKIA